MNLKPPVAPNSPLPHALVGYLDLADEGCELDGVVDDTLPFAAAVVKAQTQNKELTWRGDLRLTNGLLQIGQAGGRKLRLRGDDPAVSRIIADIPIGAANQIMIDLGGYGSLLVNPQALTVDATVGTRTLTMADTSAFAVGDTLIVGSTLGWVYSDKGAVQGELVRVASKTSTVITTIGMLDDSYAVSNTATVRKVLVTGDALLEGFTVIDNRPTEGVNALIRLAGHRDVTIRDLILEDSSGAGLVLHHCEDFEVDHVHCHDFVDDPANGRLGYGILAYGSSRSGKVSNVFMRGGRHLFTTGSDSGHIGIPRHITVSNSNATGMTNACFDSHFEGEYIHHNNCHVFDTQTFGMQVRAPKSTVTDCSVTRCGGPGLFVRAPNIKVRGMEITDVHDVTFDPEGSGATLWAGQGMRIASGVGTHDADDCRLTDIEIRDTDQHSIFHSGQSLRIRGADLKSPGRLSNSIILRLDLTNSTGHLLDGINAESATTGISTNTGVKGKLHRYLTKSVTSAGTVTADTNWTTVTDV